MKLVYLQSSYTAADIRFVLTTLNDFPNGAEHLNFVHHSHKT